MTAIFIKNMKLYADTRRTRSARSEPGDIPEQQNHFSNVCKISLHKENELVYKDAVILASFTAGAATNRDFIEEAIKQKLPLEKVISIYSNLIESEVVQQRGGVIGLLSKTTFYWVEIKHQKRIKILRLNEAPLDKNLSMGFGSGGHYFLGYFDACKNIEKAFEATKKFDIHTGGSLDIVDLSKPQWEVKRHDFTKKVTTKKSKK